MHLAWLFKAGLKPGSKADRQAGRQEGRQPGRQTDRYCTHYRYLEKQISICLSACLPVCQPSSQASSQPWIIKVNAYKILMNPLKTQKCTFRHPGMCYFWKTKAPARNAEGPTRAYIQNYIHAFTGCCPFAARAQTTRFSNCVHQNTNLFVMN